MKKFLIAMAMIVGAGTAAADPADGLWKTKPDDNGNFGHVQISECGAAVCGVLIQAFNGAGEPIDSPNIGRQIVWDMVPNGDGTYSDGKVYAPDRDKTYRAKMVLNGSTLGVSGCVLGGAVCRESAWSRVK